MSPFAYYRAALLQYLATYCRLPLIRVARKAVSELRRTANLERSDRPRQLLIDISIIAANDAGTGIQRTVRSLLRELISSTPAGYVVRPVRATRKHPYVYADHYLASTTCAPLSGSETRVHVEAGDLFIGLDLASRIAPKRQRDFLAWHARGVRFSFVVYDMLPQFHPEWFTPLAVRSFKYWVTMLAIHADTLFCISATVAGEVGRLPQLSSIPRRWFHLGVDSRQTTTQHDLRKTTHDSGEGARCRRDAPQILMVGTIEPRKGHRLVLEAFERLWRNDVDVSLVVVGRSGWAVAPLIAYLENHPEFGKRLQWYREADEATLSRLYKTSDGLILASEGEGFGLPIIEASNYRLPLLLRDLPIFREIASTYASYFSAVDADELAPQIQRWLTAIATRTTPDSSGIQPLSWQASALQFKALITQLADSA